MGRVRRVGEAAAARGHWRRRRTRPACAWPTTAAPADPAWHRGCRQRGEGRRVVTVRRTVTTRTGVSCGLPTGLSHRDLMDGDHRQRDPADRRFPHRPFQRPPRMSGPVESNYNSCHLARLLIRILAADAKRARSRPVGPAGPVAGSKVRDFRPSRSGRYVSWRPGPRQAKLGP